MNCTSHFTVFAGVASATRLFVLPLMLALGGICAAQESGVDRPGQDYKAFWLNEPNWQACQAACNADGRCRAYTYVRPGVQGPQAACWLKSTVPGAVRNDCCVSGEKGGSTPVNGEARVVNPKMSNGYSVDWCLHWDTECGKPAADYYCRSYGYPGSVGYNAAYMNPTWVMGDNRVCGSGCAGLTEVVCAAKGTSQPPPAPPPVYSNNVSGTWQLTSASACKYPTRDGQQPWTAMLTLNEQSGGAVSASSPSGNLNVTVPANPDGDDASAPKIVRNGVSGNQFTIGLHPQGWVSELKLVGRINGNRIDGAVWHYGNHDCDFTMIRQ